jgi:hypothetical protein
MNEIFISITILETNTQKERPLPDDLFSVNQVFSMTTIMSGNFFKMNCDFVDYLTASTFSRECTDAGRRHFLSNTEPSLLNWL